MPTYTHTEMPHIHLISNTDTKHSNSYNAENGKNNTYDIIGKYIRLRHRGERYLCGERTRERDRENEVQGEYQRLI